MMKRNQLVKQTVQSVMQKPSASSADGFLIIA